MELELFKIYIETNSTNNFIKSFKFFAKKPIFESRNLMKRFSCILITRV